MKAYLEPEEVGLMEKAATNLRDKILICLLFRLGCRVSEALGITVGDIDFNKGTVIIVHLKRLVKLSCSNCGAGIALSHSYCPKCGVRVNETT